MDNRELQWYEGKYGRHPAACNCYACCEARRLNEQEELEAAEKQARMRIGAEERVAEIKKRDQDNCYARREARRLKEQSELEVAQEQAKMRVGAEERIAEIKKRHRESISKSP